MVHEDDSFFVELMNNNVFLHIFIINGFQIHGRITEVFPNYIGVLERDAIDAEYINKAAISTIKQMGKCHF